MADFGTTTPDTSVPVQVARDIRPMHQLIDLHRVVQRMIRRERQIGYGTQTQRLGNLATQIRRRQHQRWNQGICRPGWGWGFCYGTVTGPRKLDRFSPMALS